ncbi:MAG: SUMF1/EgtB/PvdO family nonheme iron enzyme [Planctomycetota bacterium]
MNKKVFLFFVVLAVMLNWWGTAQAVDMEFVVVGDPCNAIDTFIDPETGVARGAVNYKYSMAKYEVSNAQYAEFLNAVAASDPHKLWDYDEQFGFDTMGDPTYPMRGGITRSGSPGSYAYAAISGRENMPVLWVSWRSAARFVNWMHNGQQNDPITAEYGAYDTSTFYVDFPGSEYHYDQTHHDPNALYWLPTWDEWYKAAFYKGGGMDAGYWDYPVQCTGNQPPPAVWEDPPMVGGPFNVPYAINYYADLFFPELDPPQFEGDLVDVNFYTIAASAYGTFQQGGNAAEWVEGWWPANPPIPDRYSRPWLGGAWYLYSAMENGRRGAHCSDPEFTNSWIGFRLAAPAPPENCTEVQAYGYRLASDLDENCYINFGDFAIFAEEWLQCNDPTDANCLVNW